MHPLLNLREHFMLPPDPAGVELRAFTHGLMPRTVPRMMDRFVEDWQRRGVDAWNEVPNHWLPESGEQVGWWTLPAYLGDRFMAPLIGAPEGTCMMQPNVHWTVQCLLSAPELFTQQRREVIVADTAFPSVLHSVHRWARLSDFSVRVLSCNNGFIDRAAVLAAIRPETALLFLSHIGFTTGERLPDAFLQEAATRLHTHGGLLVVDGYHANATMPIDVQALGLDVYMGGLLKEACGASGNAYVYLRPGLALTPRLTGWFGNADPFGFAPVPTPHPNVRRRFLGGTTAVASLYHAVEGVRVLLDAGLDAVRADSLAKTAYCIDRIDDAGLILRSPRTEERRGAMVILEVEAAHALCAYLKQHHVFTDSRQDRYLRLAPFVWNTMDELERTFDVIEAAVRSGAYLEVKDTTEQGGPVT